MAKQDVSKAETDLLQCMLSRIKLPEDIEEEMERAANQRGYIKSAMLRTDPEAVSTNYVFQFLSSNVADMFPKDPEFSLALRDRLWGQQGPPPHLPVVADTLERMLNFYAEHGSFKHAMRDVVREAYTVPMGVVKLIWHEDFARDPIGARHRDIDEAIARYKRLYESYKAKKFDNESSEYERLVGMADSLRPVAISELNAILGIDEQPLETEIGEDGEVVVTDPRAAELDKVATSKLVQPKYLPDVQTFQYFSYDLVELEDFRWDWNVTRFGDYWNGRWAAHRVRMTANEIIEKYELDEEDADRLCSTEDQDGSNIDSTQKHREDLEDNESDNSLDVWELQDAETRRVYVFTEHFYRFLAEYEPTAVHNGFFTLFPLQFNPVAGEFIGISNVDLQRPLQDEINERRTHEKLYLRATLPRYLASASAFSSAGEMQKVQNLPPFAMMQTDAIEDPNKHIFTIKAGEVNQAWFDLSKPTMELQIMGGRPTSALGGSNPNVTATQTAFSSEQLGGRVAHSQTIFQDFMTSIGTAMAQIILQTTDELEAKYIAGPGAVLPPADRDALFAQLNLKVSSFMNSEPNQDAMLNRYEKLLQIAMMLGRMPNPDVFLKEAFETLKVPLHHGQMFPIQPTAVQGGPESPGPEQGAAGQAMTQMPGMDSVPGRSQTVQDVAAGATQA